MLSYPINSSLQLMKLQLNILAFLGPSVHTLKSDFFLSFSFNISGVVYIRSCIQEVCVISVLCEMLSYPINSILQPMKLQLDMLACLGPSVHTLKSDFSLSFSFSISWVIYIGRWIQELCVISVVCEMLSYPIDSSLQRMNIQLDTLAGLRPSVHNLKSDFSLSFSFSISGVIYIGRWIQEVCVISVLCEMLSYPINSTLQLMKLQLNIIACLGPSVHTLKSDFSLSFSFSISGVVYIRCWIQEVSVISVVCEMLSYPIDSSLQLMKQQLNIIACLGPSVHTLKSDFSLSFSFSITGVVYIRCWIQEVCVISVLCEMLSYPINSILQPMKLQLDMLACLGPSVHTLKSDFSLSFSFSISGVIYIGRWIQELCVISVVCEMLSYPIDSSLQRMNIQLDTLAGLRPSVHNLKSEFLPQFQFQYQWGHIHRTLDIGSLRHIGTV